MTLLLGSPTQLLCHSCSEARKSQSSRSGGAWNLWPRGFSIKIRNIQLVQGIVAGNAVRLFCSAASLTRNARQWQNQNQHFHCLFPFLSKTLGTAALLNTPHTPFNTRGLFKDLISYLGQSQIICSSLIMLLFIQYLQVSVYCVNTESGAVVRKQVPHGSKHFSWRIQQGYSIKGTLTLLGHLYNTAQQKVKF